MLNLLTSSLPLFIAAATFVAGTMLLGTSLPLRMAEAGFGSATIGLVMVPYSFGFIAGSLIGPRLIARVGHIRVYAGLASLFCALALVHGAYLDAWLWAGLRIASGLCGALMVTVIESWINARAPVQARGRFMSIYMLTYYLAGSGGQLLVGLYAPGDYRAFSLAAGLIVLSSLPLSLSTQTAPSLPPAVRPSPAAFYRASPIAVVGAAVAGFAQSAFYQLAPLYVTRIGFAHEAVAHFMALAVLASMALQYPLGRLADRSERTGVILGIGGGVAISALLVALLGPWSTGLVTATSMLFCALSASLYPSCVARINERTEGLDPVAANATLLLCYGFGQFSGPVVAALTMSVIGPAGLFLSVATVLGIFALWCAQRRARGDLPAGRHSPIVPVAPDSMPVVAEHDVRLPPDQPDPPVQPGGAMPDAGQPHSPPPASNYANDDDPK